VSKIKLGLGKIILLITNSRITSAQQTAMNNELQVHQTVIHTGPNIIKQLLKE